MHVPTPSNPTAAPVTVHTDGVVVLNDTGKPDDAVAPTATGDCANVASASGPNVIDCDAVVTAKLCWTGGAGLYAAFPP